MNKKKKKNLKKKKKIDPKTLKKNLSSRIQGTRLKILILIFVALFLVLIGRLAYFQFYIGDSLSEKASRQQTINKIISSKRGTIYDCNNKVLAKSATVDTITINPTKIVDAEGIEEKTIEKKKMVAQKLAEIFDLDYEDVYKKVSSTSSAETIAKKIEQDKVDILKVWMKENKITSRDKY